MTETETVPSRVLAPGLTVRMSQYLFTQFAFPSINTIHVLQVDGPLHPGQRQAVPHPTLLVDHDRCFGAQFSDQLLGVLKSVQPKGADNVLLIDFLLNGADQSVRPDGVHDGEGVLSHELEEVSAKVLGRQEAAVIVIHGHDGHAVEHCRVWVVVGGQIPQEWTFYAGQRSQS